MKVRASSWPRASVLAATVFAILALSLALASPAEAKPPAPKNRIYFMVSVGFYADYDVTGECIKFAGNSMRLLIEEGVSGTWEYTESAEGQSGAHFEMASAVDMGGMPVMVEVDGYGRLDSRGRRSSFAGVGRVFIPAIGQTTNFAFSGREVKNKRTCVTLVNELEEALAANQ